MQTDSPDFHIGVEETNCITRFGYVSKVPQRFHLGNSNTFRVFA